MGNSGSARGFSRGIDTRQRLEFQYHIKVTGDAATPTIEGDSEHLTIARNGVGDYTLTLNPGAARALLAQGTGAQADSAVAILAATTTTLQIEIRTAGVAADDDCYLLITARDSADET